MLYLTIICKLKLQSVVSMLITYSNKVSSHSILIIIMLTIRKNYIRNFFNSNSLNRINREKAVIYH